MQGQLSSFKSNRSPARPGDRAKIRPPRFHSSAYDGVGVGFGFFGVVDTGGRLIGVGLTRGFGVVVKCFLIGVGVGVGVERLIGNGDGVGLNGVGVTRGPMDANGDGVGLGVGVTIGGVGSNRCRVGDGFGVGVQSLL